MKENSQAVDHAAPAPCGYDAAKARQLARIVAECSSDDDILDFNDLTGNSDPIQKPLQLDLMMRPDLGIEFVRRVGNPKSLPVLSVPCLRWLKVAASMKGSALPKNWKQPSEAERDAVAWAEALASDPYSGAHAELVNACLLCGSSTIADVASLLHLQTDHVEAYHDLFFNVMSRRSEQAYINLIAYPGRGTCLPISLHSEHPSRPLLATAVRCENLPMLLRYLGWVNAVDPTATLRVVSQSALLMLLNELPGKIISLGSDPQFSQKLLIEALRSARSTVGQETTDGEFTDEHDDFSKFAEGLFANDVKKLEHNILLEMEQSRTSP